MSGFKRHIAASIAITAVFIICALTLFVSAAPVVTTGEGTQDIQTAGAFSYASMVPDVVPAEAAPAEPPQEEAHNTAAPPAPMPPAPDVSDAPVEVPADAPEVDPAKKPGTDPTGVINPPRDLVGEFVPDSTPYVYLTWDPNNLKKDLDTCLVYREKIAPVTGPVEQIGSNKKGEFKDYAFEPDCTYRYWVTALAKWGEESGPSNVVEVQTYDSTPPNPPQGVDPVAIEPGVSIDWDANTEENLLGYNVYKQRPNGQWRKQNSDVLTDNHYYDPDGVTGNTYGVTAVNYYMMESDMTVAVARQSVPFTYEEDDPSITVEGLWVIEQYQGPTNGKIRVAGDAGARLHFAFTGRQVQMVAANYWTCGSANIYIDGEFVAEVNMYSDTTTYQVTDFDRPGLKYGAHVLTVEVLGYGNPVEPYNFVNIDCFVVR